MLEEWVPHGQSRPIVVYLGEHDADEDGAAPLQGAGYAIHIGRPPSASAPSFWVANQAAAADLLARIAFGWGARSSSP